MTQLAWRFEDDLTYSDFFSSHLLSRSCLLSRPRIAYEGLAFPVRALRELIVMKIGLAWLGWGVGGVGVWGWGGLGGRLGGPGWGGGRVCGLGF